VVVSTVVVVVVELVVVDVVVDEKKIASLSCGDYLGENALLRNMIQEEIVPAHGSIYIRSIAPGPGYYGTPGICGLEEGHVASFGSRPASCGLSDNSELRPELQNTKKPILLLVNDLSCIHGMCQLLQQGVALKKMASLYGKCTPKIFT